MAQSATARKKYELLTEHMAAADRNHAEAHEAGHLVVALALGEPVKFASVNPATHCGTTRLGPVPDYLCHCRVMRRLAVVVAGYVAESLLEEAGNGRPMPSERVRYGGFEDVHPDDKAPWDDFAQAVALSDMALWVNDECHRHAPDERRAEIIEDAEEIAREVLEANHNARVLLMEVLGTNGGRRLTAKEAREVAGPSLLVDESGDECHGGHD